MKMSLRTPCLPLTMAVALLATACNASLDARHAGPGAESANMDILTAMPCPDVFDRGIGTPDALVPQDPTTGATPPVPAGAGDDPWLGGADVPAAPSGSGDEAFGDPDGGGPVAPAPVAVDPRAVPARPVAPGRWPPTGGAVPPRPPPPAWDPARDRVIRRGPDGRILGSDDVGVPGGRIAPPEDPSRGGVRAAPDPTPVPPPAPPAGELPAFPPGTEPGPGDPASLPDIDEPAAPAPPPEPPEPSDRPDPADPTPTAPAGGSASPWLSDQAHGEPAPAPRTPPRPPPVAPGETGLPPAGALPGPLDAAPGSAPPGSAPPRSAPPGSAPGVEPAPAAGAGDDPWLPATPGPDAPAQPPAPPADDPWLPGTPVPGTPGPEAPPQPPAPSADDPWLPGTAGTPAQPPAPTGDDPWLPTPGGGPAVPEGDPYVGTTPEARVREHVTRLVDRAGAPDLPGYPAAILPSSDPGMALTPGPRPAVVVFYDDANRASDLMAAQALPVLVRHRDRIDFVAVDRGAAARPSRGAEELARRFSEHAPTLVVLDGSRATRLFRRDAVTPEDLERAIAAALRAESPAPSSEPDPGDMPPPPLEPGDLPDAPSDPESPDDGRPADPTSGMAFTPPTGYNARAHAERLRRSPGDARVPGYPSDVLPSAPADKVLATGHLPLVLIFYDDTSKASDLQAAEFLPVLVSRKEEIDLVLVDVSASAEWNDVQQRVVRTYYNFYTPTTVVLAANRAPIKTWYRRIKASDLDRAIEEAAGR
jgi:hypothetical protein